MYRLIFLFFISSSVQALCQVPVADFTLPPTICKEEVMDISNNSINADFYAWDFCSDDFLSYKEESDLGSLLGFSGGFGYKVIESNGNWFGFVISRSNGKLYRLNYGDSPMNSPLVTDLGNPDGKLSSPEGIDIVKANNKWYGFVGSLNFSTPTQGIIRLDFGSSLQNVPIAVNLGNFGFGTRFRDLKVIRQGIDFILLLVNYNGNSLVSVNFRDDLENPIDGSNILN
ncbi:MAG TPA: hypothetical protein PKN99_03475 [Cyclobacteriaceae bacterium]|nr:hypothetical protein [Cyclobacteriaceae bacterium]